MLQHLRVFSEYNSPAAPTITPLIRIDMWHPKHAGFYGSVRMMKRRVAQQVEQLQAAQEGERAIMLWWLLAYELYADRGADPLSAYMAGRVDTRKATAMLKPLSDELQRRRITIDLIYVDNEGGFGYHELGQNRIRRILRSRRARSKMPAGVAAINPDDLTSTAPGFLPAVGAWDDYARKLKYDALKKVVSEEGLFDVRPSASSPVQQPSAVNFWSVNPTWTIYDYNGWPQPNTSLDGWSSGPSCYVGSAGNLYLRRVHHPVWNDMINILNQVRSCLGKPGSVVHPVLSHPWMTHPWIQEEMIAHMVRMGINWSANRCAFLYWNANQPTLNDPLLAEIMARHDEAYPAARNLPEIPLDIDTVTTLDYTTTYEDFLANMGDYLATHPG